MWEYQYKDSMITKNKVNMILSNEIIIKFP